ncbi:hypothetical protein DJ021_05885 [Phenylobacterium hankyongense]|uniref:Uncharacterized protein n=1 Tax=Phenylobacterium hankyongense TaxID=1813876 RepID=A0A328AXM7_9CAUL|nr:hypothetical protein [Phenylobacterium hankyongense]RAK59367.1 hypothetical protein DJ021_05885 [Phenylobacterium hankyongense]
MSSRRITSLIVATALLGAVAGAAQAADKANPLDFTVRTEPSATAPAGLKSLKWDARKGRWGLTLNMDQPDARPSTWNDVAAGAYYRITPSLQVGGAVALGDQQLMQGPKKLTPDEGQPRVRLESSFKF